MIFLVSIVPTLEISEADDGDEPDPHIGVTKYRLFVKGYRGETFVVTQKVRMYVMYIATY